MGNRRILLENSPTGVQHYAEVDNSETELILSEFTPTSVEKQIIDDCRLKASLTQSRGAALRHVASIGIGLRQVWRKEWEETQRETYTWGTFLAIKLNNSDYKKLRTWGGRL